MKKKLSILLIIFITIICIFLGTITRKKNAIIVTQIKTKSLESLSYMLETTQKNIIMIDGGSEEDSKVLEEKLLQKGGRVNVWFITNAYSNNFGALKSILKNGKVKIDFIYKSFNEKEWYEKNQPDEFEEISQFIDLLNEKNDIIQIAELPIHYEFSIDNLHFKIMSVKNPELVEDYAGFNQSMMIKVDNTYKSMLFMGNTADSGIRMFKNNNLNELKYDAIQKTINDKQNTYNYLYKNIKSNLLFENEKTLDDDISVKIW